MKICILNASNPATTLDLEYDSYTDFRMGRASCFEEDRCIKVCRSWHNWAYALETEFFVYNKPGWQGCYAYDAIVILVNRHIEEVLPIVKKLKLMKKKVAVSFHEGVGDFLAGSGMPGENVFNRWVGLYDLVKEADFYLNIFGQMQCFFEGWFGKEKVRYCSHGAPTDWVAIKKHQIPYNERRYDILIGTRTFNQRLTRNTLIALGVANKFANEGKRVLYLSEDKNMHFLLERIGLNKIEHKQGPLQYEEWLKLIADCRVVAHHDSSLNLGQIVADCALMNVQCVGSSTSFALENDVDDRNNAAILEQLIRTHKREADKSFLTTIGPDYIKERLMEIWN